MLYLLLALERTECPVIRDPVLITYYPYPTPLRHSGASRNDDRDELLRFGFFQLPMFYFGYTPFIGPGSTGELTCNDSPFQFAASFDGGDDMIEVPDQPAFHFTTAMTVAAWVKPTSTAGLQTIVNKWDSPDSYMLRIADGHFQFTQFKHLWARL